MAEEQPVEQTAQVEGPAAFLDVVFETIEAHVNRTGEEYAEIITGIDAVDAGEVDAEETAVLHLYVPADLDRGEALELIALALDRIADENDMGLARQGANVQFLNEEPEE